MKARSESRIAIIGAGIGGLVAALALVDRGFAVRVFEQAEQLREIGAGLQLSPNATKVLDRLNLSSRLRQIESRPEGKEIRLWNTGETWKLFDLGAESVEVYGHPYLTLYRADLHRILVEALEERAPGSLRLGARCIGLSQADDSVTLHLAGGESVVCDVLIGADGVHSSVRAAAIATDRPVFSGCVAWRGVLNSADLPQHLRSPVAVNWVGPGAHVIHYPLRAGSLINFVGIVERNDWTVESWNAQGTVEECLRDFSGWHPDVLTLASAIATPYKWALMVREPMTNWTSKRVTLLGDAAHATLPFLAQGAAMAIEDGYVLARCIDEKRDDIGEALMRYQSLRIDRTSRVVRSSSENAKRFHNPRLGDATGASEYVSNEWSEPKVRERYEWLFSYDVDALMV
ncbi:monooxygenase [Burkholderia multivorans]|uniref:FAD-dependent monooxygenase n=1 Tax=Burkholderia multivorans TaxID=87883 RepID=UPI000CFE997E|nr:FAD-dependent monooxygenase [Burkholderia multivorans]AYY55321.1 monooxygenase [Burkholderia multivorans]AYZ00068.1 monooxygenase [Burkholderia multivorans]MBU9117630.1 FAD-dependent monooxygenase [Burkholderia multivorans]MCA8439074.1 FAD-dependent monooxygenase [Burkholderia multivorans]MDN8008978.1 FAD-dependent monooxygenase [Burkholderia multivorans]